MKVFITILVCKLLRFVGKLIGKGSSFPGQIALKLCPDILSRVTLPEYIIAKIRLVEPRRLQPDRGRYHSCAQQRDHGRQGEERYTLD